MRIWRRWAPLLPFQVRSGTIDYLYGAGLAGIRLEIDSGLNFSLLSDDEIDTAIRYALQELNSFPRWLAQVAGSRPMIAAEVFRRQITADASMLDSACARHQKCRAERGSRGLRA